MNKFEARLKLSNFIREVLVDSLDDGTLGAKDLLALENDMTDVVDLLFEELQLEVLDTTAPNVTIRLTLDAE